MGDKPFISQLDKAESKWKRIFGENHLKGFRNDFEKIWVANLKDKSFDESSTQLAREVNIALERPQKALRTLEEIISKGEIIDGLTGGIFAYLLFSGLTNAGLSSIPALIPSIAIFFFFTLMNHGILYTKAFYNLLCYNNASPREEESRLLFKRAWNRKVLVSVTSVVAILFAASARATWTKAYKIGLKIVENWLQLTIEEEMKK